MLQFYFLSVLINAFAGYLFFFGEDDSLELNTGIPVKSENFKLVVGIIAAVTGLFKILSPIEGDIPVVGDLIPAASAFICGFILLIEYYRNRSTVNLSEQTSKLGSIFRGNKKIVGAAAMIVAVLHFLFPRVLFL